ncbi:hypothetical protein GCM10023322_31260 [Rugosimonospora acidiphila]|uniref:DUF3592 domain-containing protein n=1 Tax=Rugosimonospora acidiphila TaxID=556531 RepID=A0ABP9RU04_9ACTN
MLTGVRRREIQLRYGLVLAAVLTGPTWIAGIAAILIPPIWGPGLLVGPVTVVLAAVVVSQLFPELRRVVAVACVLLAFLAATFTAIWMPSAVLDVRGTQVAALVATERVVQGKHDWHKYELRGTDGRPIPGTLTEYDDVYDPGDRVDVVVDPGHHVAPEAADELNGDWVIGIIAAGLLVLTTALSIGVGSRTSMEQVDLRIRGRYRSRH